MTMATKTMKPITKPYNCYNVFFILERAFLLEARRLGSSDNRPPPPHSKADGEVLTGYEFINLPPLPPRYRHLEDVLPSNWYDPGRNKIVKRKHSKTHGVASFKEIARHVADSWRNADRPTREFVDAVAQLLKRRYLELENANGIVCLDASARKVAAPPPPPTQSSEASSMLPRTASNGNGIASGPKIKRTEHQGSKSDDSGNKIPNDTRRSQSVRQDPQKQSFATAAASKISLPFPSTIGSKRRSSAGDVYCQPLPSKVGSTSSQVRRASTGDVYCQPVGDYADDHRENLRIDRDLVLDPYPAPVASTQVTSAITFGCGMVSPEAAPRDRLQLDRLVSANVEARAGADRNYDGRGETCGEVDCSDVDILRMYYSF